MKTQFTFILLAAILFASGGNEAAANDQIDAAIQKIIAVQKNGVGHAEAAAAMKALSKATKADIPKLLEGMDLANQLSANWLRGVIVATAQRDGELPLSEIQEYFADATHSHLGRLMAFELLSDQDKNFANTTIPKLADDPSLPLRRMAIDWHIKQAEEANDQNAIGLLGTALEKARDVDQVQQVADLLDKKSISIDLRKQLGFVTQWQLVGTFDNKDEAGFDVAYGPEKDLVNVSVADSYTDQNGDKAKWSSYTSGDPLGVVDLVEAIGPIKGATAYAYAVFNVEDAQDADIRVGCINAHKIWVNGELVISNEIYHNGISPDKFAGKTKLKEGENVILIKICQNEQTEPWAQRWQFQLRVCDKSGKAIKPAEVQGPEF